MIECRPTPREYLSSSGQYRLVVQYNGSWSSSGVVFRVADERSVAEINRNFCAFPFSFIEDHPNGHSYLVCGEDYQGQTVIELDTGRRRDFLPDAAQHGVGFCWAEHRFDRASQLLVVLGCIWAAPYEYRFYDFSDPMERGWPELEFEGAHADAKWPEIGREGVIRTYGLEPGEDAESPVEQRAYSEICTYRRKGNELRFVSRWQSPAQLERNRQSAESERAYEAWLQEFRASDPLYLEYKRQLAQPGLSPEDYESHGVTYEGWCPTFSGQETRWCRRIVSAESQAVDLEWAVRTGPIKLVIYSQGKDTRSVFFSHTAEGMAEAFAYARTVDM